MNDTMRIRTVYLGQVYHPAKFRQLFQRAVETLRQLNKVTSFDAIAFTGTSGAALAYPLALKLNKSLICVRKDSSHYDMGSVEGHTNAKTYVIVDDFIDSGKTIDNIVAKIARYSGAKPVAIYLYIPSGYYRGKWWQPEREETRDKKQTALNKKLPKLPKIPVVSSYSSCNFSVEQLKAKLSS